MSSSIKALAPLLFLGLTTAISIPTLNPACAPGGNFDLSHWELQLPIGTTGEPDTISTADLEGCSGYQDPGHHYFFTESGDGALVMKVPGSPASSGCVTTANSEHCRTELREENPDSWSPNDATNILSVTLAVEVPDESEHGTVIGQVHISDTISPKPVCELYYNSAGQIAMGVEQTIEGDDEVFTNIAVIPVGQVFDYVISYQSNVLSVSINGATPVVLSTFELDAPQSYFKVGNYNQGNDPSDVHFFAISVEH